MSKEKKEIAITEEETKIQPRISGGADGPAGFDEVDNSTDLRLPRLAVLQGLSQIVIDGKARMGDLANSLTKELLPQGTEFIPLFMFKTRAQFETGKGLVMLSRDNITVTIAKEGYEQYLDKPVEEVPGSNWNGKEPPTFNLVYNFPVLLTGRLHEFPISISCMKTSAKTGKDLISMARLSGEDMFARVYSIKTKIEKNDNGTYAVPVIEYVRRCTDEEYTCTQRMFNDWYKQKQNISVDLEEEHTAENIPGEE